MTGAEKRYFKLYCMRHVSAGQGIHAELFDAIAAMTEYDEPALRKVFAGSAFMRRFPITKRRLYEALLHSLDAFHAGSSVDDKLRRLMHHVELLFNKALYADAMKALHSAQLLARANDRQAILLQVMEWERRMMERANYSGIGENELNAHAEAVESVINEWRGGEDLWAGENRPPARATWRGPRAPPAAARHPRAASVCSQLFPRRLLRGVEPPLLRLARPRPGPGDPAGRCSCST